MLPTMYKMIIIISKVYENHKLIKITINKLATLTDPVNQQDVRKC